MDRGDDREDTRPLLLFEVQDANDLYFIRKRCMQRARRYGFDERQTWEIAIAVSELVTNVVKYARTGTVQIRRIAKPRAGIEIVVADRGPGFDDPETAARDEPPPPDQRPPGRRDGLGLGLGAVVRLMNAVWITNGRLGGALIRAHKYLDLSPGR